MNNLHLTVLNEGSVYPVLRATTLNLIAGRISEMHARYEVARIVSRIGIAEADRFEEEMPTEEQITVAVDEVLDWHKARWAEDMPSLPWVVENPLGHKARFASEPDAFGYLLKIQGNSVHHATKYEGWKLYPESEA